MTQSIFEGLVIGGVLAFAWAIILLDIWKGNQ